MVVSLDGKCGSPGVTTELNKLDAVPVGSTPEEALRNFEKEIQFWNDAMRLVGNRLK
jgi:predicted RNase H-like HicB family nuclease